MILQRLVSLYETMLKKGRIAKMGWGAAKISYALNIDSEGNLIGVMPLIIERLRNKKTKYEPQEFIMPEAAKRSSGINPQFLWDKSSYMLGVDNSGKTDRAKQCFENCAKLHQGILEGVPCQEAKAICKYFAAWRPEIACDNKFLKPYLEDILNTANLCFVVEGKYVHENKLIAEAWDNAGKKDGDKTEGICLVTGKKTKIARLHPHIKGVRDAQSSGAAIVSFNSPSYESYGHNGEQGLNAPVGEYAAFAYTTALNYLLANSKHNVIVSDTAVVFWSDTAEDAYADILNFAAFGSDDMQILKDLFSKVAQGKPIECDGVELQMDSNFHILGLSPNAARLSVRFYLEDTFGNIIQNIKNHYDRLELVKPVYEKFEYLPIWAMLLETANKNARNKNASPLLAGSVLKSVLSDSRYPDMLLQNIILRVKAEQDNNDKHIRKIGRAKAAIIKACLLKNYKRMEEVATVSLNEESNNIAYVLGRLFSVLEEVQESANPGITTTIKDRYFNSACGTPSVIFPILLRLANSHLRKIKADKGRAIYFGKKISGLENRIEMSDRPIPTHLSLENQGVFMLGYYHQNQARFTKKEDK